MDNQRLTSLSPSLTNGLTPDGVSPTFSNTNLGDSYIGTPDKSAWIGTAISAAVAAGVAIYNGVRTKKENAKQRKWQEEQVDKANEYNLPVNQKQRLKDAGINLLGSDMSNSPSQQIGNPTQFDPRVDGSQVSSLLGLGIESALAKANIDNINEDTKGKQIENQTKGEINIKQSELLTRQIDNLVEDTHVKRETAEKLVQDVQNSIRSLDIQEGQLENSVNILHLDQQKFEFDKLMRNKEFSLQDKYYALEYSKLLIEQYLSFYQKDLYESQANQLNRAAELCEQNIKHIEKQVGSYDTDRLFNYVSQTVTAVRDLAIGFGAAASGIKGFSVGTMPAKPTIYQPSAKDVATYGNILKP